MTKDKNGLTHLSEAGEARMVDVSGKAVKPQDRQGPGAASSWPRNTGASACRDKAKKGDVFATARIAGIMAAKQHA